MIFFTKIGMVFLSLALMGGIAFAQIPGSIDTPEKPEPLVMDFTENPCPEPREAMSKTPNDLKVIQEDITRFTLCLQRAQLLSRLNDLASENAETLTAQLDEKLEQIALEFAPEPMIMPEIVAPQMPSNNEGGFFEQDNQMIQSMSSEEDSNHTNWTINEIKGQNGVLMAVLKDEQGNIANVKSGDVIQDTEITVTKVSQTNVHISENNKISKLKWSQ